MLDTPLIDLPTAAQRLGVSPGLLRAAILRGELPAVSVGVGTHRTHYRLSPDALTLWAKARSTAGGPQ